MANTMRTEMVSLLRMFYHESWTQWQGAKLHLYAHMALERKCSHAPNLQDDEMQALTLRISILM